MLNVLSLKLETDYLQSEGKWVTMNYLITGGTGCIGQSLITQLEKMDASITVLSRSLDKAKRLLSQNITVINTLTLENVEQADIIINLAGEPIADKRWSNAQKDLICKSRWSITQNIVNLIKQSTQKPKLFISASAIGIYGKQDITPITEEFTQYTKEFTNTVCDNWERIALKAENKFTRVALLRTGIVLAKNQGVLAKMLPPFKFGLGGKMGSGGQVMSWIHIEDMVNAIVHIINEPTLTGAINMTAENAVTNKEFSYQLAKILKRPCIFTTPKFVMKAIFGEMSDLMIYGQNVYPKKLLSSKFSFKFNKIDHALQSIIKTPDDLT